MMLTKKLTILMLIGMSSLLQACSVAYDLQQDAAINACQKIVDWSQRSECIKKNQTSFDQYEKQRQDVINKK